MLGLPLQHPRRNEEREIGILGTGGPDAGVETRDHALPEREAIGPDDLAAADRRVVGQLGFAYDIHIPAVEIIFLVDQFVDVSTLGHDWLLSAESRRHMRAIAVYVYGEQSLPEAADGDSVSLVMKR